VAQVNRKASDEGYGLKGAFRGQRSRTTTPEKFLVGSADLVCRNFTAFRPNQLWVTDLTYFAMKRPSLRSVHNRRICQVHCGLPRPRSLKADLAFDALKQALYARGDTKGLIPSSVHGPWVSFHTLYGKVKRGRNKAYCWKRRGSLRKVLV